MPNIDDQTLGLAPVMNVDDTVIERGHKVAETADVQHINFEIQHEVNCRLPECVGNSNSGPVEAETKV